MTEQDVLKYLWLKSLKIRLVVSITSAGCQCISGASVRFEARVNLAVFALFIAQVSVCRIPSLQIRLIRTWPTLTAS